MAQARTRVAGRGPWSSVCSSSAFCVEYVASPGSAVRWVSGIGTGSTRRLAALAVERAALVVGVDRGGRDDDQRADETVEAVELLAVLAIHRHAVVDDVRAGPERGPQLRVVRAVGRRPTRRRAPRALRAACPSATRPRRPSRPPPAHARRHGRSGPCLRSAPPAALELHPLHRRNPMPRGEGCDDAGSEDDPGRDLEREVDAVTGRVLGCDEHPGDELLVPLHAGAVLGVW